MKRLVPILLFLCTFAISPTADAHLATFGSWEITRQYLGELFVEADDFLVKRKSLTPSQIDTIQKELGFQLYPEDHNPTFYIAVKKVDNKRKVLGVAVFIDPRVTTSLANSVVRLEVGIAVNTSGKIHRMRVFEYHGDLALTRDAFLGQFRGRNLKSSFRLGKGLVPVEGEEKESQLVANAAHEALYLMKVALGH